MKVSSLQLLTEAGGYCFDGKKNCFGMYSMFTEKGKISADTVYGLYKLFCKACRNEK